LCVLVRRRCSIGPAVQPRASTEPRARLEHTAGSALWWWYFTTGLASGQRTTTTCASLVAVRDVGMRGTTLSATPVELCGGRTALCGRRLDGQAAAKRAAHERHEISCKCEDAPEADTNRGVLQDVALDVCGIAAGREIDHGPAPRRALGSVGSVARESGMLMESHWIGYKQLSEPCSRCIDGRAASDAGLAARASWLVSARDAVCWAQCWCQ
jgi:hypothetical protein